jgi:hypothetical protein
MKAEDVVQQLAAYLPKYSDKFTTNLTITSLTRSGSTATAVTSTAHGLAIGSQANIVDAQTPINISSFTRSGTVGTIVTATAHDFTEGFSTEVITDGATQPSFNGTFTLLTVPDRYTVTVTMTDSGPTSATGSAEVLNGFSYLNSYNGLREITAVPTTTSFQFAVPTSLASPARGTPLARTLPRISAILSEDLIINAYEAQAQADLWLFVVLGDVAANNSRQVNSDAVDNIQRGDFFRQQIIQPMSLYVVVPSSQSNAGREARDLCEELLKPICQSVLFKAFPSYLSVTAKGPVQFVGHGFAAYHRAFYMHAYEFQQVVDLSFSDTVGYDDDVAFRDIALTQTLSPGNGVDIMTANINLDEVI